MSIKQLYSKILHTEDFGFNEFGSLYKLNATTGTDALVSSSRKALDGYASKLSDAEKATVKDVKSRDPFYVSRAEWTSKLVEKVLLNYQDKKITLKKALIECNFYLSFISWINTWAQNTKYKYLTKADKNKIKQYFNVSKMV